MRLTRGVALFALFCLGAACSSDDDAQNSPNTETSLNRSTPPTTSAAPTTTSTTTAPTTTAAPTTTIDPTDALIAEIEADLNEGEQVFLAGAGDPASEASRTNLARYFTGTTLENFEAFYDVLVAEGFKARPNPDVPSVLKVNKVTEEGGSVIVEFCRIDAGVVVEQLGDGTEIIVNDEIIRYEFRVPVVQRDGTWTAGGGEQLSEQVGVATCD